MRLWAIFIAVALCVSCHHPVERVDSSSPGDEPDRTRRDIVSIAQNSIDLASDKYQKFRTQKLIWTSCGQGECTNFRVPMDWTQPQGESIEIAMKSRGLGDVIFYHPGGPGVSAIDHLDQMSVPQHRLIALDTRGTGHSSAISCGDQQMRRYLAADMSPDSDDEEKELVELSKRVALSCREHTGDLVDHVSSSEAVYDYEMARLLLKEQSVSFWAISYGTVIAQLYRHHFPDHMKAAVLDSSVKLGGVDDLSAQISAIDEAISDYLHWRAERGGMSYEEAYGQLISFLDRSDRQSLGEGETPSQTRLFYGIVAFLYRGVEGYRDLDDALDDAMDSQPQKLLKAADSLIGEDEVTMRYLASFTAITCADHEDKGVDGEMERWKDLRKDFPLGSLIGPNLICPVWTSPAIALGDLGKVEGAPVLMVHSDRDPIAPLNQARKIADQMPESVMVEVDSRRHGVSTGENSCVNRIVSDYWQKGSLPVRGTHCPS